MKFFRIIWNIFKFNPIPIIMYGFLGICLNLFAILSGLLIKSIFDYLGRNASSGISSIYILIMLLVSVYASRGILAIIIAYFDATSSFIVEYKLQFNMFEAIYSSSSNDIQRKSNGEIISCFRDDSKQTSSFLLLVSEVVSKIIYTLIIFTILININLRLTLLVFSPIILTVIVVKVAYSYLTKYRKAVRLSATKVIEILGEVLNAALAIQISGKKESVLKHFEKENKKRKEVSIKDSLFSQLLALTNKNIVSFGTGLTLLFSAKLIKTGEFTLGDFYIFVFYINMVTDFVEVFGNFISQIPQTKVSITRMLNLFKQNSMIEENGFEEEKLVRNYKLCLSNDSTTHINDDIYPYMEKTEDSLFNVIEIKNIKYEHEKGKIALDDISFKITKGSRIIICGRMGSGKSTLLKVIQGLLPTTEGKIIWDGVTIEPKRQVIKPPVSAYTPQDPCFLSDTIRNNILLGISENYIDVDQCLYYSAFDEDVKSFNEGINTIIGTNGMKLSGGQKQRMAISRMLCRNSQILILDDVSTSLDIETQIKLWERLLSLKDRTILGISNSKHILQRADSIIVLSKGKILSQGTYSELITSCEEFKMLLGDEV